MQFNLLIKQKQMAKECLFIEYRVFHARQLYELLT